MFAIFRLILIAAAGVVGFALARRYVRTRLRFVDAIRSPIAPWVAGIIAALVTYPLSFLPLVTAAATLIFGIGTGFGTASGVKALKRGD
ncbi:MAG: hypothetical protein ACHQXA_00705 [Gemmatimonadales bacterium]